MRTNDRPSHEGDSGEPSFAFGIIAICERTIGARLVDPESDAFKDLFADGFRGDGCSKEFPVGFCVQMTRVKGKTVALDDGLVPRGLHFVNAFRDKAGLVTFAVRFWVQGYLVVAVDRARDGGSLERGTLKVKAE